MTKTIILSDEDAETFQTLIEVVLDEADYSGDLDHYEKVKDNVWEQLSGKKRT